MQPHDKALFRCQTCLGREACTVTGVVHSVNDPDTVLKDVIRKHITTLALTNDTKAGLAFYFNSLKINEL